MHKVIKPEGDGNGAVRIGFFICHCGVNISSIVNVAEVRDYVAKLPNVVVSQDYKFMCSDPGQDLIKNAIKTNKLNRVVVAACSPLMHEGTFRAACEKAGINRFLFQMANIREHCSWVHDDKIKATEKAKALAHAAISRVAYQMPMEIKKAKLNPLSRALVASSYIFRDQYSSWPTERKTLLRLKISGSKWRSRLEQ